MFFRILPAYTLIESNKRRPHINLISTLWAWLHAYSKSDRERSVEESGRSRKRSYGNNNYYVACAEEESSRGAARMFGVDEKRIREWQK